MVADWTPEERQMLRNKVTFRYVTGYLTLKSPMHKQWTVLCEILDHSS